jgi:hypothetical protein
MQEVMIDPAKGALANVAAAIRNNRLGFVHGFFSECALASKIRQSHEKSHLLFFCTTR